MSEILGPLGLDPSVVAFTDSVPWFFVKHGPRSQGDAIINRFNPIARKLELTEGALPERPTAKGLVGIASSADRKQSLRAELDAAAAPLLITLGQQALDVVRAVAHDCHGVQH